MREASEGEITGINVTPLVDVTLVLLVVFMVTSKVLVTQAMPFEVPKGKTSVSASKDLVVTIDPSGVASIEGRVADEHAIVSAARAARAKNPETKAIIRAATGVPWLGGEGDGCAPRGEVGAHRVRRGAEVAAQPMSATKKPLSRRPVGAITRLSRG